MTPKEARALSAPEFLGFLDQMDSDIREQNRALKKRGKRG